MPNFGLRLVIPNSMFIVLPGGFFNNGIWKSTQAITKHSNITVQYFASLSHGLLFLALINATNIVINIPPAIPIMIPNRTNKPYSYGLY
ncbi:hypothetical protein D3C80_1634720 [compost metagenome]